MAKNVSSGSLQGTQITASIEHGGFAVGMASLFGGMAREICVPPYLPGLKSGIDLFGKMVIITGVGV